MGIFFTSQEPVMPTIHTTIAEALRFDPQGIVDFDREASHRTVKLRQSTAPKFNGGRFLAALALSGVLLFLAIWTADHNLADISKTLMTSFQTYNGILVGLLGGEAQKASAG